MVSSSAPRPARAVHLQPKPSAESRLELVDAVLADGDALTCAQAVLRWLGRNAPIERALCAVVDESAGALVGLAGDGVPHARVVEFRVDLDDADDPLIVALSSAEPISFPASGNRDRGRPLTPLGAGSLLVVPLTRPEVGGEYALGLLLLGGGEVAADAGVRWAARLLSTRLLCVRNDLRRQDEQRLRRDRAWRAAVIDAVTDPILLTDSEGRMLVSNVHAERLFSASDSVSDGKRRAIALNNMLFSAAMFTAAEQGASARELLLVDPEEGRDLLFELLCTPLREGDGGTSVVSVLRNVNDLRRATEEIEEQYRKLRIAEADTRAERDRLDLVLNAVVDPVLVTDPAGGIVLMNPPAEHLFGVDSGADRPMSERILRSNDAVFSSFLSNVFTSQAPRWRGELTLTDPVTERRLPFEAIAGRVVAKRGEDVAVVTILHDRSEAIEKAGLYEQVKRHTEELQVRVAEATAELSQQNEVLRNQAIALEQASQAKSRFLANISHELRTPLNAVLGYAELLRKGVFGELQPVQGEKLERIDANARHLLSIINDLLDISRIEAGRMPVHIERFGVAELVDEVMREIEPIIARSRLSVSVEIPPAIPVARSDRQKTKQVLMNLLSNAIKFTPEGSVQVRAAAGPESIAISIADTGIGIPADQQEHVFDDFYQMAESSVRKHGGTGLGLAICRRLAAVLGGRIELDSEPGRGSTFRFYFARELRGP